MGLMKKANCRAEAIKALFFGCCCFFVCLFGWLVGFPN